MESVNTLATLVLGGAFDATELGDNDIVLHQELIDDLQKRMVTGFDDVHIELIDRAEFDLVTDERDALQLRLNTADERKYQLATADPEIAEQVESALRRSFNLGQVYWQQADSDSTCQQNKCDQTMETQAQHILNMLKSINTALNSRYDQLTSLEQRRYAEQQAREAAERRVEALEGLLDTPHTVDWFEGVRLEAGHQIKRWGSDHDAGKAPADWFWLIGYLAQKAMTAQMAGNTEKAKHHTISTGAAMLNWFRSITGDSNSMRPGIDNAALNPTAEAESHE